MLVQIRPRIGMRAAAVALGTTLVGVALLAAPAAAKPGTPATAVSSAGNCVVALQKGTNINPARTCFTTFTQAISFATHGAVTNAPASAAKAMADAKFKAELNGANSAAAAAPQASLLLGIDYEGLGFGGAFSITWTGPVACTGPINDIDYAISLPSSLWDQISSFQTLFSPSLCLEDHYFLQNFGLPRTGFFGTSSPVPTMNVGGGPFNGDNNTRSITWS